MQNRPNISLLTNAYLETYQTIEACLMQNNFSILLSKKVEAQVFDIVLTAQKQEVPTKKLECSKDLNKFCNNLIYEYNKTVSYAQQIFEGIFIYSLLVFIFSLLDIIIGKEIFISTLVTCTLIFVGYFISSIILRHKNDYNPKLRSTLVFGLVFLPFMFISFLKSKIVFLLLAVPFNYSLLLILLTCIIASISYSILTKKYDLFIFIKKRKSK